MRLSTVSSYNPDRPPINSAGQVAFIRTKNAYYALYVGDRIEKHLIADTTGSYLEIFFPALNERGTIAFMARLVSGQTGIFTGPDPDADRVIAEGDALAGSTVTLLPDAPALNNRGDIAFAAQLADGRRGIFRAER